LDLAYQKLVEVNSDERMRELAWAREKAARDEHGRLLFAREEGRAEGRAEGLTQGLAQGRAFLSQSLQRMLPLFYPEFTTQEILERIRNIEETERLQEIMNAMIEQKPFEEIAEIL
ncbi:MAG: hypothetical protein J6J31_11595, partial [Thermoguttaceae bacterium]|nr:hypothetical protein [Thermoguttaceae bacterium]